MTANRKNIIILAITLFAILLIAYANHFLNGFHFDDFHTIVDNVYIRNIKNIPAFFSDPKMFSSDPDHYGLRSLVTTSLAIDYWMGGGLYPFYFHLSTFIWHILLCVMLYFVYKRLLNLSFQHNWINYIALFAAGWFAIHTANGETINYVISRSDVLSTFFIVASFAIFMLYPERRKWYLYILPAIVGVFAKETVLVLIILLFFYINLFEKKLSVGDLFKPKNFKLVWNTIVMLLPILLVVIAVQVYTLSKISGVPGISNPAGYYWLTQCFVWLHYFTSFFFPVSLSGDTDWTVIFSVVDKRILIGVIFVIALIITIFKTSKRAETRPIAFGLIWFAAALLPTSIAPFAEVTNDHRMYFPFIGLALSVVTSIGLLLMKREQQIMASQVNRMILGLSALLIISLNAYGVHQRNKVWKDEDSFWYDVTIKSPLNGRGLMNYGLSQMSKGNYEIALGYFERAQEYIPVYGLLYVNIGIAKANLGHPNEADINFKKGIFFAPGSFEPYAYYSKFLMESKKYEESRLVALRALEINPNSLVAMSTIMTDYQHLGLWDDLERVANHQLVLLPNDPEALNFLAAARGKKQPAADAPVQKEKTPEEYLNLSLVFYNMGIYEKCIETCKRAISLKPEYADAYSNMAAAYNKLKQWDKGLEASKKALEIDPNHKFAKGNLAWAQSEKEQ